MPAKQVCQPPESRPSQAQAEQMVKDTANPAEKRQTQRYQTEETPEGITQPGTGQETKGKTKREDQRKPV